MASVGARVESLSSLWDDKIASGLNEVDRLVYRSNVLGSDPRITNYGGGNTSAKTTETDPLTGESLQVLWVKGSGGDLGTMKRSGLASLYLDRLLALEDLQLEKRLHEDEIVPVYSHCVFNLNPTAPSIDTPLHAFVPFAHVDHLHPDSVIAIAASEDAERLSREVFGGELGFLPWKRPGFDLGLQLRDLIIANPGIKGAVMGKHGLICWADSSRDCYELSLFLINRAAEFIASRGNSGMSVPAMVSSRVPPETELLPVLRGKVTHDGKRLIAYLDTSAEVLAFLDDPKMPQLAAMGTSCPDHFLRTKIRPLVLPALDGTRDTLDDALGHYRDAYAAYYNRCKHDDSPPMRNPNPSVVLIPGFGMVTFGKNKQEAVITAEFYRRAIEVMRGAETISKYSALPEQEAFDIEYWLLEEAKLKRQPPEKELSRQIALVTGAAQGIGLATAKQLAALGACVAIVEINADKLPSAHEEVEAAYHGRDAHGNHGRDARATGSIPIQCDVTDPRSLRAAFDKTILEFGGLDICVVSAGNARRGTVADTSDEDYDYQSALLMKAYFQTMRAASQIMIQQGTGGSIVLVASKNAVATGSNAAIYSAAKAFELHLMRTTANDLAKHSIRCNAVNPDAVLQGSGIWSDTWRAQTAASLGIKPEELEEHYRKRSLLGLPVRPEDVAEAIAWLASEARSGRTTGCVIPVDAGVREGFLR